MNPLFAITDGTTRVSFFGKKSGIHILDWTPSVAEDKDGGVWQGSKITDERQLIMRPRNNIIDTLTLAFNGDNIDAVVRDTQNLRRLLEKAMQYWTTKWQQEPVWIEARGDCETNIRYALLFGYTTPNDDNPFEPPLGGYGLVHAMDSFPLVLEHGFWKPYPPGESECLPISADDCWCQPSYLIFNGTTSSVDCGSDASIDNLTANAFTVDIWIKPYQLTTITNYYIISKRGWSLWLEYIGGNQIRIWANTLNAAGGGAQFSVSNPISNYWLNWMHIAMTFDNNADGFINLYVNGIQPGYDARNARITVFNDAAVNLLIGRYVPVATYYYYGYIGWIRISNFVRYTNDFITPARCKIPEPDANTLAIWIREGQGATIDNYEGTAARDGTASNCTWGCDCECED